MHVCGSMCHSASSSSLTTSSYAERWMGSLGLRTLENVVTGNCLQVSISVGLPIFLANRGAHPLNCINAGMQISSIWNTSRFLLLATFLPLDGCFLFSCFLGCVSMCEFSGDSESDSCSGGTG